MQQTEMSWISWVYIYKATKNQYECYLSIVISTGVNHPRVFPLKILVVPKKNKVLGSKQDDFLHSRGSEWSECLGS